MSKPQKKGKKSTGAAPRTTRTRVRNAPANPVPQSPPSPYAQAVMFAIALLVTAAILFVAMRDAKPRSAKAPGTWVPDTSLGAPKILPPTEPPPDYSEIRSSAPLESLEMDQIEAGVVPTDAQDPSVY